MSLEDAIGGFVHKVGKVFKGSRALNGNIPTTSAKPTVSTATEPTKFYPGSIEHLRQPPGGRDLIDYEHLLLFRRRELEGKRVLDLGAGPEAKFARQLEEAGIKAKVFELSPDFLFPQHRKRVQMSQEKVSAVAAIGQELPFQNNSLDVIVGLHVLEHMTLEGFFKMCSEMARVLSLGGRAYVGPSLLDEYANDMFYEALLQNDEMIQSFADQQATVRHEPIPREYFEARVESSAGIGAGHASTYALILEKQMGA